MNSSPVDPVPSVDTLPRRSRRTLSTVRSIVQPFVVLLIVVGVFMIYGWFVKPKPFLTAGRLPHIATQTTIVGIGALGMTVIIIGGGIDLSVGTMLALTAVSLAAALRDGMNPTLAVLFVIAIGIVAGALNGLLITMLRLVPFIVTLGTMKVFQGLAEQIANPKISVSLTEVPRWLTDLLHPPPEGSYQLIATGAWTVLILTIVMTIVMRYTVFGRHVFAIGSNESTARLCGIPVTRTKIIMYSLGGFFMALAGILNFSYLGNQGDPKSGPGAELEIIAAVVIGGGSLSGGRGSVLGSIVGALTMTALTNGCDYAGVGDSIEKIIIGGIIIVAVSIDQLTQSRMKR